MNSFLIAIGAALVLALTAALVGPQFIDWNGYRAAIEEEGARVARRPIKIDGDVEVRLLPEPVVRASTVRLLKEEGGSSLMTAKSVDLSLDLAAFLLGRIEIAQLTLIEPELRIEVLADGNFDLGALPESGQAQSTLAAILRQMTAKNARLVYDDPVAGGERSFEHIDLNLTSSAVTGPFKFTGAYGPTLKGDARDGDNRPAFSITLGVLNPDRPAKVSGRIELGKAGQLSFDGSLGGDADAPGFVGRTRLERHFDREQVLEQSEDRRPDAATLVAEAAAQIGLGSADLEDLEVSISQGVRAVALNGSARLVWDDEPEFALDLATRQLDLDSLLDGGETDTLVAMLTELAGDLEALVRDEAVSGRASLQIGGAILRGELMRDLALAVKTTPEILTVSSFSGRLPGQSSVDLSGDLSLVDDSGFTGEVVVDTLEANRLINWAAPEQGAWLERLFAAARGKLSFRSELDADDGAINLGNLSGFINTNPFTGNLEFQTATGTPLLLADLDFDSFDLDRYLPRDASAETLLFGRGGEAAAGVVRPDLELDLSAEKLIVFGREAADAVLKADVTGDVTDIEAFSLSGFAGSDMSGSGRLITTGEFPQGNLQIKVEAEQVERLLTSLRLPSRWMEDLPVAVSLNDADLEVTIENSEGDAEPVARVAVAGAFGETSIDAALDVAGSLADVAESPVELTVSLEAALAEDLFGPNGLVPVPEAPLSDDTLALNLEMDGSFDDSLDAVLVMQGLSGTLSWAGSIDPAASAYDGEAELRLADARPILPMLRLSPDRLEDPLPVSLAGPARLDDDRFEVEIGSGLIAGSAVTANFTANRSDTSDLVLDVTGDEVALTPLVSSVFGQREGTPGQIATPTASIWGTSLIDADVLRGLPIALTGQFDALRISPGVVLTDARLEGLRGREGFEIRKLSGSLGEGGIELSGTVGSVDHALAISGRATFERIPLLEVVFDGSGRELMGGTSDGDIEFSASGRSMLSLVSSIAATGSVTANDTTIARIDATSFFDRAAAGEASEELRTLLADEEDGVTRLGTVSGPISAASGRFRVGESKLSAGDLIGESTTFIDVPSRRFDQEIVLYTSPAADAMHLALIHAGPFDAIKREVEMTALPDGGAVRWIEPELPEPLKPVQPFDAGELSVPEPATIAEESVAPLPVSGVVVGSGDPAGDPSSPTEPEAIDLAATGSTNVEDHGTASPIEPVLPVPSSADTPEVATEVEDLLQTSPASPEVSESEEPAEAIPPAGLIDTQVIELPMPGADDAG